MRSLVEQIKEDYAYFTRLWEKLEKGETDSSLIEDLSRVLSWKKESLNTFKEMKKRGIEGVSWAEVDNISKDIKDKEMNLLYLLYSISTEAEKAHNSPYLSAP